MGGRIPVPGPQAKKALRWRLPLRSTVGGPGRRRRGLQGGGGSGPRAQRGTVRARSADFKPGGTSRRPALTPPPRVFTLATGSSLLTDAFVSGPALRVGGSRPSMGQFRTLAALRAPGGAASGRSFLSALTVRNRHWPLLFSLCRRPAPCVTYPALQGLLAQELTLFSVSPSFQPPRSAPSASRMGRSSTPTRGQQAAAAGNSSQRHPTPPDALHARRSQQS